MSQDYGTIDAAVWEHPAFQALSPTAKLVFAFLKTCRQGNGAGIFPLGLGAMEDATGLERDALRRALEELAGAGKSVDGSVDNPADLAFALYDEASRVVYLPGHMRHFPPAGPNRVLHCARVIDEIPSSFPWRAHAADNLKLNHRLTGVAFEHLTRGLSPWEAPSKGLGSPSEAPPKPLASPPLLSNDRIDPRIKAEVGIKGRSEIDAPGWSKNDHQEELDPGPGGSAEELRTWAPLAVYRYEGRTVGIPPLSEEHDRRRTDLARRFGVGTRGQTREAITRKIQAAIEAAGGKRA